VTTRNPTIESVARIAPPGVDKIANAAAWAYSDWQVERNSNRTEATFQEWLQGKRK
jgi:hypothetical protein